VQYYISCLYKIRFLEASSELLTEAYGPVAFDLAGSLSERHQARVLQSDRSTHALPLLELALECVSRSRAMRSLAPRLVSGLFSSAFSHYLDAGRYSDAFLVLTNPLALRDPEVRSDRISGMDQRLEHLQRFALVLCENGRLDVLCR
jgi:hypothetical protein